MHDVKESIKALVASNHRQERYLVGGWSEDGSKFQEGMRDKVSRLEKLVVLFWAILGGVWGILAALVVVLIKGVHLP
jgi:hypothetical protein